MVEFSQEWWETTTLWQHRKSFPRRLAHAMKHILWLYFEDDTEMVCTLCNVFLTCPRSLKAVCNTKKEASSGRHQ